MNCLFGIDIGGTNIKLAVVSQTGEIITRGIIPTRSSAGPEKTSARVADWFRTEAGVEAGARGAGVGCAGLINSEEGVLYSSPNLPGWKDVPLREIFSENLSLPVVVDNDVNCAAYGEFLFGSGRDFDNFVCVTLGTGVGGGLIIGGRMYRGFSGQAGELGHTKIVAGGELCSCGSRGCLEAYIKADAIVERARKIISGGKESFLLTSERFTVRDIAAAADNGDGAALETLRITGWYLGVGLSNVVHLINPGAIAVGGGIAGAGEHIIGPALDALAENVMNDILLNVSVVSAELGNDASSIGAAMLASEKS